MSIEKFEFYVYLLIDPRNNLPFYVGKGKNNRYLDHFKETNIKKDYNKLKINKIMKIKKLGLDVIIKFYKNNISEKEALDLEKYLIIIYGRINLKTGILTNLTDGGDGVSGKIFSKEEREKLSMRMVGQKNPNYGRRWNDIQKQNLRNKKLGIPGTKHTKEWREKMSKVQGNHPNNIKHGFYQFDKNGNLLKIYDSLSQFGRDNNILSNSRSRIFQSLKNYACSINDTYLRELDYKNVDLKNNKVVNFNEFLKEIEHRALKKTIQKDINGNIIKIWDSRVEICKNLVGCKPPSITWAIKNKKLYKGYYWENG